MLIYHTHCNSCTDRSNSCFTDARMRNMEKSYKSKAPTKLCCYSSKSVDGEQLKKVKKTKVLRKKRKVLPLKRKVSHKKRKNLLSKRQVSPKKLKSPSKNVKFRTKNVKFRTKTLNFWKIWGSK